MTQLFDRLPDRILYPLAGANPLAYGMLLLDIAPLFFDQIQPNSFPSRGTVCQEIESALAVIEAARQEKPGAVPAQATGPETECNPAAQAYRPMLAAGRREEEMEDYPVRTTVPQRWTPSRRA